MLTTKAEHDGKVEELIILGRRTIEPRKGFWGIPAGMISMPWRRVDLRYYNWYSRIQPFRNGGNDLVHSQACYVALYCTVVVHVAYGTLITL